MKTFNQSLDKYLTTPPDDGFEDWAERTTEKIEEWIFNANEDWITRADGLCNKWLNKLFSKGYSPELAAKIIERAIYQNRINT